MTFLYVLREIESAIECEPSAYVTAEKRAYQCLRAFEEGKTRKNGFCKSTGGSWGIRKTHVCLMSTGTNFFVRHVSNLGINFYLTSRLINSYEDMFFLTVCPFFWVHDKGIEGAFMHS